MRAKEFMEDGTLVIRVELPGMDPERDIRVTVVDDVLTVAAERMEEIAEERDGGAGYRAESHYDSFRRSIALPAGADPATVTARYDEGVLEVRVPAMAAPPTRIPVATG